MSMHLLTTEELPTISLSNDCSRKRNKEKKKSNNYINKKVKITLYLKCVLNILNFKYITLMKHNFSISNIQYSILNIQVSHNSVQI